MKKLWNIAKILMGWAFPQFFVWYIHPEVSNLLLQKTGRCSKNFAIWYPIYCTEKGAPKYAQFPDYGLEEKALNSPLPYF